MRICESKSVFLGLGLAVAALVAGSGLAPVHALDGTRTPSSSAVALTPVEAFRSGTRALKTGEKEKGITSLQYAAEKGHAIAQWKLGRMYADGDGVPRDDLRAFKYFS